MTESTTLLIKDTTANPAPLGLFGFGMTTILLNVHNAGFIPLSSMILAMGLCFGGAAQVLAGIMEWKKNNTFGLTAFVSYGSFWLSLAALVLLPKIDPVFKADANSMGIYLAVWGLFTLGLFFGTLRLSVALAVVFGTLVILFCLLSIGEFTGAGTGFKTFTGWEGIVCGASAFYTAVALVLNEIYGSTILPLGTVVKKYPPARSRQMEYETLGG